DPARSEQGKRGRAVEAERAGCRGKRRQQSSDRSGRVGRGRAERSAQTLSASGVSFTHGQRPSSIFVRGYSRRTASRETITKPVGGVSLRYAIPQFAHTFHFRAVRRTEEGSGFSLDTVSDDAARAMIADRSQRIYGAFKTVKRVSRSGHGNLKGLVVFVVANF